MAGDAPKPALISVRDTAEAMTWGGKPCPTCNVPIEVGQRAVLCPKCYTPQHRTCWEENGNKCAIDGTPANVLERVARAPAAAGAAGAAAAPPAPAAPAAPAAPTGAVATAGETAQPAVASASSPAPVAD